LRKQIICGEILPSRIQAKLKKCLTAAHKKKYVQASAKVLKSKNMTIFCKCTYSMIIYLNILSMHFIQVGNEAIFSVRTGSTGFCIANFLTQVIV